MPLTLSGAGSFSFFKGPSLTATPLISGNELASLSTTTSSKSEKTSSLLNPIVPTERRARSVDAAMNRNRRDSNCSSRTSNKKPVWIKTFILRIQQTFFKFNNESGDQLEEDDNRFSSRTRPSVDAARQVVSNDATDENMDGENTDSSSLQSQRRKEGESCDNENLLSSSQRLSTSSVFEICAQTPRHKTKETEVLRQVGRFTIVREREDFDTIIFDQCHCSQKPCKYSSSGGVHPPSPLKLFPELVLPPSRTQYTSGFHRQQTYLEQTSQFRQHQPQNSQPPSLTSRSGPPGVHRYTFYSQPPSISSASRHSLPCLYSSNNNNNNLTNTNNISVKLPSSNTISPASAVRTSKAMVTAANITSTSCRKALPTSASSPNLMNVHNRSKNESVWCNNKSRPLSGVNIHASGGGPTSTTARARKSILNMNQEFLSNKRHNSAPVAPTPSSSLYISLPSKFSISPQEPHATISSHSGRKFEVELYSSSVASSSNSSASSEITSSSPASTSSMFSFASSPGTNSHSPTTTINRQRSSTLSSKHGRKFEVTVLSSDNNATKDS